ncbi:tRNA-splicing endonuclease [uncultured archaeon]|nr:tRNA-splicing endonuclease [uncultured archaeon]
MRNAACTKGKKQVTFSDLAAKFSSAPKFIARYFTYKDWRDRGLVAAMPDKHYTEPNQTPVKKYPLSSLRMRKYDLHGVFFKTDLMTVAEEEAQGKALYEDFWFGQYGSYKAADRGRLNKLDVYDTLFLLDKKALALRNMTRAGLMRLACDRRKDFASLYAVYKDWREKGYVIKTGFKFGTHFRVYFPGAKPMKKDDGAWIHSKHVIHVFPKSSKLLISEWARAIRVAHSVRKTFILAVPGKTSRGRSEIDFVLYHRRGGEADSPQGARPRYAMLSLSEEEYIGGQELARAINEAKRRKMELLLAIADRETAVTYYRVIQIKLPGSRHDYFEIDWFQP